jgi:anti-sigma factor ChrR (cupin superfamily)
VLDPRSWAALTGGGWRQLEFADFRPGVRIHVLYGGSADQASAAVLHYAPGASVPPHEHVGFEHILVLDGAQSDERGTYSAGALVINPPGTRHRVWSEAGCVALLIWERPVRMLAEANSRP